MASPKINFVPDDYVQNSETRRINLIYLVLLVLLMVVVGGSFTTVKLRQRALVAEENIVNEKMFKTQQAIKQFEALQAKRKVMMKTALTTAGLLETVPRSVLLASLTNDLPGGVSLLKLKLIQKKPASQNHKASGASKYNQAQAATDGPNISPEKLLEMHIDIEGIAPTDLQVAAYIEHLSCSSLLDNVALVESKEHEMDEGIFRRFKLTAMLTKELHLTSEDVEQIKTKGIKSVRAF